MASLLTWFTVNRHSTYTTQVGERRSITLADGSMIDLNARSAIRIKFSKSERNVDLMDGQALFEVAQGQVAPVHCTERRNDCAGSRHSIRCVSQEKRHDGDRH